MKEHMRAFSRLYVLIIAVAVFLSCATNRVDKVYSGSVQLKTFDFKKYMNELLKDEEYIGRRCVSGTITWYDHYFKKKHQAEYRGVEYLILGLGGSGGQLPSTVTYFPLLYSGTDRKCHYYFDVFSADDQNNLPVKSFGEQRLVLRNSEDECVYRHFVVLRMDDIDDSRTIRFKTRIGGGQKNYEYVTGITFNRDFTIYNEAKTKKLITIFKGSFIVFNPNPPFKFYYR